MSSITGLDIDKRFIRIDERYLTANNRTYLTADGDLAEVGIRDYLG